MKKFWQLNIGVKKFVSIILVVVPQVSIFFLLRKLLLDQILSNAVQSQNTILFYKGIYLASFAISAFFGSFTLIKIQRKKHFIISYLYRLSAILSILFFENSTNIAIPIVFLGSSFGMGFPSDLAFLADNVDIDIRGRVSGYALFFTFIIVMILIMFSSYSNASQTTNTVCIFILQFTSIGVLLLHSSWDFPIRVSISLKKIKENKKFMLFLIPWMIFSLVNGLNIFLTSIIEVSKFSDTATVIQFLSSCIFCIVAGIVADYYGRKPGLLIGFVVLGIVYSLVPYMKVPFIDILTSFLNGMAWSFIMVSFLFTIVGDLSPLGCKEIYYAISGIMWLVIETSFAFISSVVTFQFPITIVSTILSLSMFLSVIPLLYSSETIPPGKIVDRRLNNYFEKVLKILDKKE